MAAHHTKDELNFPNITIKSSTSYPTAAAGYYVQSPRDSHEDVSAAAAAAYNQSTLPYNNGMDSPLNRSSYYARTSNYRSSSASWISGHWKWPKGNRKRNNSTEWNESTVSQQQNVVGDDSDGTSSSSSYNRGTDPGRSYLLILFMVFVIVFSVFCLIVWGITRPYRTRVRIMNLIIDDFHFGEGSDQTGVPTKFVTVNGTVTISVRNPAKFFGVSVSFNQVNLIMYSEITVSSGELKKYFQPRGSSKVMSVNLSGKDIPLYGAASLLPEAEDNSEVPVKLKIEVRSRGYLIGKLIKRKHTIQISCSLLVKPWGTEKFKFLNSSCAYN